MREADSSGAGPEPRDYRSWHLTQGAAERYDALYSAGTYDDWVWGLEQKDLEQLVRAHTSHVSGLRHLDFACGTGRILAFLGPMMSEAVGVDVSPAMLALAEQRVSGAKLIAADITKEDLPGAGFDLVTVFRFFLNAEPPLRDEVLAALRRLIAETGLLILNVHGNPWSMHGIPFVIRRYVLRQQTRVLSLREMRRHLERHGFAIVEVVGQGWCTRRVYRVLGRTMTDRLERILRKLPFFPYLSVNFMVACRPTGAP